MKIINFKQNQKESIHVLNNWMNHFFSNDTLVINDTRGMIIPSVLPFIEFVCTYDQRVLPLLKNTNVIFTYPFNEDILKYYQSFGLTLGVNVILTENMKEITLAKNISSNENLILELKKYNFKKIIPFFVNDDMEELSQKLNIPLSVSKDVFIKANDKLLLKKYLQCVGLPTIDGDFTSDITVIKDYFNREERYLFKDPLGVSGYGFWDNRENTIEEIENNYGGKELIIERFITKESSPSIQFFINEMGDEGIIFGMTDQLLENGKVYLGNTSPSRYIDSQIGIDLIQQSVKIIEYISSLGYTGFGGIDFIVDEIGKVYATEVNARFTGATYPAITSMFLHNDLFKSWEFYNYEGDTENLNEYLEKKSISEPNEKGIFPLGLSGIEKFGKVNVLEFK